MNDLRARLAEQKQGRLGPARLRVLSGGRDDMKLPLCRCGHHAAAHLHPFAGQESCRLCACGEYVVVERT